MGYVLPETARSLGGVNALSQLPQETKSMKLTIRKLAGIAVGIAVAIVIMMIAEAVGYRLFGLELGPDGAVPAAADVPAGVNVAVLLGWFLGGLIGGYTAILVSRFGWTAWPVAVVIWLAVILRFVLAAAPTWMMVGGVLAPLLGGWLAQRLSKRTVRPA